jgi:probable HAF family extracellular repeat protein
LPEGRHISARKVNARGDILGSGDYPGQGYGGYGNVSFLWTEAGGFEVLEPPADGIDISPADLNDRGQIVGDYGRGTDAYDVSYHAFLREANGEFKFLGFPGEYWSAASFVNNAGQVAGVFNPDGDGGHVHAFLWSPGTGSVDLGQLTEGDYLNVNDFSEKGHMVGESWSGAWFWSPETGMVGIPTTGGSYNVAGALNDFDQVVGWSWAAGDRVSEAFVWSPASGVSALPSPDSTQGGAGDINNHGRIVGYIMPVDAESYGWYTIPALWAIPDPSPQGDPIALLITKVKALRDGGAISKSESVLMLQALESALRFRDGGKVKQACEALDRCITHVRQLTKRNALEAAAANELADLAQKAVTHMDCEAASR